MSGTNGICQRILYNAQYQPIVFLLPESVDNTELDTIPAGTSASVRSAALPAYAHDATPAALSAYARAIRCPVLTKNANV
eukprot:3604764-Rhodomonas_salina.2